MVCCDCCVGQKILGFKVSHRFAWLASLFFLAQLLLCILGAEIIRARRESEPFDGMEKYFVWFCFCGAFRFIDVFTALFTAVRRRIHPRRRTGPLIFAFFGRALSFFGGLALCITAIVFLSTEGFPPPLSILNLAPSALHVAFFGNFGTMALFYLLTLNPCSLFCLLLYCIFSDSSENPDEEFDQRHYADDGQRVRNHNIHNQNIHDALNQLQDEVRQPPAQADQNSWIKFIKKIGMADIMGADDVTCPICCSDYQEGEELDQLKCGHYFHGECFAMAMSAAGARKNCPICRQPLETAIDQHKV